MRSSKEKKEVLKQLLDLPTQIETDRLVIRKFDKGDGEGLLNLLDRNDNREFLREAVDEAMDVQSLEDAEIRIRSLAADFINRTRFVMGIWSKETKDFIGNIWIEPNKWEVPSFEIGYYLDQGYTKKGLATEAVRRSMDFVFDELRAYKIILITRDNNEDSYKLAERLNFVKEGHFREGYIDAGKRFGLFYFGMLKSEYVKETE
ncbi:MAG: GNAT family N-acetyltransferase [Candidatus Heimdallarchaeota archaeon]|nr:GNAT family N-acetyltransferase [Candidatus Heimdallarchaeota archaeon]